MSKRRTTEEEVDALRAATREAHEAIQSLRQERRDTEQAQADLRILMAEARELLDTEVEQAVAEAVSPRITEAVDELREGTQRSINDARVKVTLRLDEYVCAMLGIDDYEPHPEADGLVERIKARGESVDTQLRRLQWAVNTINSRLTAVETGRPGIGGTA